MDTKTLEELAGKKVKSSLPHGFVRVCAVLPEHQAFIVRRWEQHARKKDKG